MMTPRQLQDRFRQGHNISQILREEHGAAGNTEAIIELAYDLQTGSYVRAMQDPAMRRHKAEYAAEIARVIRALGPFDSVLEAGVGEATTLSGVLRDLGSGIKAYGFDISWSRIAQARTWLESEGIPDVTLCTGSLFHIPLAGDSIDVVYTSHSIEPNGGREEPILRELYRVARRYVVLLEPGYELAGEDARQRMEHHGYCRNLKGTSEALGFRVTEHRLFPYIANPLNPTALTIIEKRSDAPRPAHTLACPAYKTPLEEAGGMLFSPEALSVYPVLAGIPCLRIENAVVASTYPEVTRLRSGT